MLWAFALASAVTTPPDVAIRSLTVSHGNAGTCVGGEATASASVAIDFDVANADDAVHRVRVYEDGVLQATLLPSVGQWLRSVPNYVLDGAFNTFASAWVFSIELVRLSDSTVLDSTAASAWVQTYGTCAAVDA